MFFVLDVMTRSSQLLVYGATTILVTVVIVAAYSFCCQCSESKRTTNDRIPPAIENRTFQNIEDGIRLKVPEGWVVQDIDNFHLPNFLIADENGFLLFAVIYPRKRHCLVLEGCTTVNNLIVP